MPVLSQTSMWSTTHRRIPSATCAGSSYPAADPRRYRPRPARRSIPPPGDVFFALAHHVRITDGTEADRQNDNAHERRDRDHVNWLRNIDLRGFVFFSPLLEKLKLITYPQTFLRFHLSLLPSSFSLKRFTWTSTVRNRQNNRNPKPRQGVVAGVDPPGGRGQMVKESPFPWAVYPPSRRPPAVQSCPGL
jgi:hypothetical protein